jgi:hypothetical protein
MRAPNSRPRRPSEASFPSPQAATAALPLEGLSLSGPIAAPARPRVVERPRTVAAGRSIPGDVDRELAPVDLTVVEEPDRLGRFHVAGELDEREAARASRLSIGRQVDLDDAARLGQKLRQGILRGCDVQVADENTRWNG